MQKKTNNNDVQKHVKHETHQHERKSPKASDAKILKGCSSKYSLKK